MGARKKSCGLRVPPTSAVPGELEREELRDRLEQSLGYAAGGALCGGGGGGPRLPRVLTVQAQRRRAGQGMVKQWSMDETKSWFYARSSSLDRTNRQNLDQERTKALCLCKRRNSRNLLDVEPL